MMSPQTPETSVLFSLAELAQIEQERIAEEEKQRAQARDERAREQRLQAEQRRAAAAARLSAEAQTRAQRERDETEARTLAEARKQAALDVARIEAEAKARLEADNAARAHELAAIQARTERTGRLMRRALAGVLALALCGGVAVAVGLTRQVARLEQDNGRISREESAIVEAQEGLRRSELARLDRRQASLASRSRLQGKPASENPAAEAKQAEAAVAAARSSINADRPEPRALQDLDEALDGWQQRLEMRQRLADIDGRQADLLTWATKQQCADLASEARNAATRAHALGASDDTLAAYVRALDELRSSLGASDGCSKQRQLEGTKANPTQGTCTNPHDPLCDLHGKSL